MNTPGPWWVDDDGFIAAGGGDEYATVADLDCDSNLDIMEREANKALVAAAPELYGSLKSVLEQAKLSGLANKSGPESLPFKDAERVLKGIEEVWEQLR